MEYSDLQLKDIVDLAKKSCSELGALSDGWLIDYETGKRYQFADEDTAMFVASAREIVLELVRRLADTAPRANPGDGMPM